MKILHVGHGFIPFRSGGSIYHAMAMMNMQVNKGLDVNYFFSGRVYPFGGKPRLKKWKKNSITYYEIINSPLIPLQGAGTTDPNYYLENQGIEKIFIDVMDEINPEIVHIQELLSLPSSLIEIVKDEFKIPLVITAHDYSMLCPTIKLFKYDNSNCLLKKVGDECCKCCSNAPINNNVQVRATFAYYLEYLHIPAYNLYNSFLGLFNKFQPDNSISLKSFKCKDNFLPPSYQKRRDLNIERLKKADVIITHSYGEQKILSNLIESNRIKTIHPAAEHLTSIKTHNKSNINYPLKFATLNGCSSVEKGSNLLLGALKILNDSGFKNKYTFHIWGNIIKDHYSNFLELGNVNYHGVYEVNELNQILDNVDVGIVPSVWEEVFGFVGLEFLKKGIPIIGSNRGGITDYTITGSTGWLNKSVTSEELANIMREIIKNPDIILDLNRNIVNMEFKTLKDNYDEISELYFNLLNR